MVVIFSTNKDRSHKKRQFFFQAKDGIRDAQESRGLGDVYKRRVAWDVACGVGGGVACGVA